MDSVVSAKRRQRPNTPFAMVTNIPMCSGYWAASRETLVADFVTLAELLDLPEKDEQDQPRIVAAVKRWLATHEDWLLILDNADDLPLAQEFLPTSHKGYILFTTRAQAAGAIAASIEVEQLNLQEGTLLLLRWTKLLEMDSSSRRRRRPRIVLLPNASCRRWMGCRWPLSRLALTSRRQAAAWRITCASTQRTAKSCWRGAVASCSTILKRWLPPGRSRFSRSSSRVLPPPMCCASARFWLPMPSLKSC